jgi:hypothetical protein
VLAVVLSALFLTQPLVAFSTGCSGSSAGFCSAAAAPSRFSLPRHPAMLKPAVSAAPIADIRLRPVANGAIVPDSSILTAGSLWTSSGPSEDNLAAVVILAVRRPG